MHVVVADIEVVRRRNRDAFLLAVVVREIDLVVFEDDV